MTETIAVIGALEKEVRLVYDRLKERTIVDGAGLSTVRGVYEDARVVAVTAGMGTVNAAAATQYLISCCDARAVIFSGIGGAINPVLRPGDVVIGSTLRYLDTDTALLAESVPCLEEFASSDDLVDMARQALMAEGYAELDVDIEGALPLGAADGRRIDTVADAEMPRFLRGTIATGNRFIVGADARARVSAQTQADCVEMEGAAVAHIAVKNGCDCLVLRAISDSCDESYEQLSSRSFDLESYAAGASSLVLDIVARYARHVEANSKSR
ncbi:methylthioadenosine nucleosidase [Coriobacterium glomerans PW2]|uniref:Methylthioadenosine nucleosidase n=1 Tax=Coriobacterium glomerans (strain ATCC 49209 / DSM 20642 / JCM 10262 / PW2) TaxID=700015 RepID=F2NAX6_CORGP|nr:5'-methylthioadenosine/S-adenosylhomocysteine nucleosidase [Coriobacterium glomerans]AEB07654.1 methylthioadenosine nucleosidase [Coriobacterium glomerans PW2]